VAISRRTSVVGDLSSRKRRRTDRNSCCSSVKLNFIGVAPARHVSRTSRASCRWPVSQRGHRMHGASMIGRYAGGWVRATACQRLHLGSPAASDLARNHSAIPVALRANDGSEGHAASGRDLRPAVALATDLADATATNFAGPTRGLDRGRRRGRGNLAGARSRCGANPEREQGASLNNRPPSLTTRVTTEELSY
jgi:hypothetical protein